MNMSRYKAGSIVLLGMVILAVYVIYPHLSISWTAAGQALPSVSTGINASPLPGINPAGQGKVWVCPMHPEIMQNHPGTCPICGMDLVESKNHAGHEHGIHVDSASIQKLGVRLARVKKSPISLEVKAYGNVTLDEDELYNVHSKFDGWIKKSYIHSIGQHIEKGQIIYEVYSPDLIMQQKAYLTFLVRRNQILQSVGDARMEENEYVMDLLQDLARERTKFLHEDVSLDTVQKLEGSKQVIDIVKIVAAESGIVTQINAREGSFAPPSATLFTLANVSRVWVTATLYPDQIADVKIGDDITITSTDGQRIQSRLDFLSPLADNNKVSVRVSIENSRLHLRPGSFVDVTIHVQPREALVLPRSAVIHTGQGDMVIISRGGGHFLPVYIDTGIETQDNIEITDGLLAGAEVVVNGQFLLDSAASISAAAQRMMSDQYMKSEMHNAQ
jgi:Cu(I)/Ag(I) efflux system membrane fusion protein